MNRFLLTNFIRDTPCFDQENLINAASGVVPREVVEETNANANHQVDKKFFLGGLEIRFFITSIRSGALKIFTRSGLA